MEKILVLLTVKNWKDQILDPCCGTGTIIKEVLSNKKKYLKKNEAIGTTWASDKNRFPLQITSLSLASHDTINIPNKIFQHNILSLKSGELISIVNPKDGT